MALVRCPSCGNDVSTQALACPKCGHQLKKPGSLSNQSWIVIVGSAILVLFLVWFLMNLKLF